MYSPVKYTRKTKPLFEKINMIKKMSPGITTVHVTEEQFREFLEAMPIRNRCDYIECIPWSGIEIRRIKNGSDPIH